DDCDPNATCRNTTGGFDCDCNASFEGSGHGAGSCDCVAGRYGAGCASLCPGFDGASAATICGGHGTCDDGLAGGGACTCAAGYYVDAAGTQSSGASPCTFTRCGDGQQVGSEGCDDGNSDLHDRCPSGPGGSCQEASCGDGFIRTDLAPGALGYEECDDGDAGGDGCNACLLEPGYTCAVGGDCAATCGVTYDFAVNDGAWRSTATHPGAAFSYGPPSPGIFGTTPGWETARGGTVPIMGAFTATLWRRVALPSLANAKETKVHLTYQLQTFGDCVRLYVADTLAHAGGDDLLYEDCVATTGDTEIAATVPTADLGATKYVIVELAGSANIMTRAGLYVRRVDVFSDADDDADAPPSATTGRDLATMGTCDRCVDADEDGWGDSTSASPNACANTAQFDCLDTIGEAYPGRPEDCFSIIDNDCDGKVGGADAECTEDCGNFVDDSAGADHLIDCKDPACDLTLRSPAQNDKAPMCSTPCLYTWDFAWGKAWGVDPSAPTPGLWQFQAAQGVWKASPTAGLTTRQIGRMTLEVPFGDRVARGPKPRLGVDFTMGGDGTDELAVCVADAANPPVTPCHQLPACSGAGPKQACKSVLATADATRQVKTLDLSGWLGTDTLLVVFSYDTVGTGAYAGPASTLHRVTLGSDVDNDGLYEGTDPNTADDPNTPQREDRLVCDPCWDGDLDFFGDVDSPDRSACQAFVSTGVLTADCDDTRSTVRPDLPSEGVCSDSLDNDCDGLTDGLDSDCGVEDCANGVDDNNDGRADCLDRTCAGGDGVPTNPVCAVCYRGYGFSKGVGVSRQAASEGWTATGRLGTAVKNDVFKVGQSAFHQTASGRTPLFGWDTAAATAAGDRLRGWLSRTITPRPTMPAPAVEIVYTFDGNQDAGGLLQTWGVCFDVAANTACALSQPDNIAFSATADTAPSGSSTAPVTNPATGVVRWNDGYFDHVVIPLPSASAHTLYLFWDTQAAPGATPPRGLFVESVLVRSDIDLDAMAVDADPSTGYEDADATCDHCVDRDKDQFGDATVAGADLATCPMPGADCDDRDAATKPQAHELCYGGAVDTCVGAGFDTKDNDCDGKIDTADPDCVSCGNCVVETGESCDDGNDVADDGCDALCKVEVGGLYITEIHSPILFGNRGEQWIEVYNATDSPYDLYTLDFSIALGACDAGNLAACKLLRFVRKPCTQATAATACTTGVCENDGYCRADCTPQTTAFIGAGEYYVVNFGSPSSSGFENPADIDATCATDVSLAPGGDVVSVFVTSGVLPELADQVDFRRLDAGGNPRGWSCLLDHARTADGRSIMLASPKTLNASTNDNAAQWCLAGPKAENRYATNRHYGSPGADGSCSEFACDGVDDDCDGTIDQIDAALGPESASYDPTTMFLLDPDGDGVCSVVGADGKLTGRDCEPRIASCSTNCSADSDGDGYQDCRDGCNDPDRDGFGAVNASASGPLCPATPGVHPDCVTATCQGTEPVACENNASSFPGNTESCLDGVDNDCDGLFDCLDDSCGTTAACANETCANVTRTLACGESLVVTPRSADFPTCFAGVNGSDLVYRFRPLQDGNVRFHVDNLGTKRYELQAYAGTCTGTSCAAAVATDDSACLAGGDLTIASASASTDYFIVVKQTGACPEGTSQSARLTVSCPEVCDGAGGDEDADGFVDCLDSDCAAPTPTTAPAAACSSLCPATGPCPRTSDWDGDGVSNIKEFKCGTNRLLAGETPGDDRFQDPDGDSLLNCEDPDDDNDGALDTQEIAVCVNPLSKNVAAHHPLADPPCDAPMSLPACTAAAARACDQPGVDANCNGIIDTREAECGRKETACGDLTDDDSDGLTDCADPDCVSDPNCCDYDLDLDNVTNCVEIACNTDPQDVNDLPSLYDRGDLDNDTIPNCKDTDDDADSYSDVLETLCGSSPTDAASVPPDNDGDGQCDAIDQDDDNDNFPDQQEITCGSDPRVAASTPIDLAHDLDQDAVCDALDDDVDGDGWLNFQEVQCETDPRDAASNPTALGQDNDDDKRCDKLDDDDDDDGWSDVAEAACGTVRTDATSVPTDCDGDRTCDAIDTDDDGDGSPDADEILCGTLVCDPTSKPREIDLQDTDHDQQVNCVDLDDDGDGIPDAIELAGCPAPVPPLLAGPNCTDTLAKDSDRDGIEDGVEDANHDGMTSGEETSPVRVDTDGDGLSDLVERESCFPTGSGDDCAPSKGWVQDTDGDGLFDGLEDADGDGAVSFGETNPLIADTDGDEFS
ncbi:MAG: hypothetical protein KC635_02370, partial [Myxococcales bacterium]|nr:hypothetical protein [Myxococcales bacterium]